MLTYILLELPKRFGTGRRLLFSGFLKLHLKPLNFMSRALHSRAILLCVASGAGAKSCKKIIHVSLLEVLLPIESPGGVWDARPPTRISGH